MVKNGRRINKNGGFVVPTVQDMVKDRKRYVDSKSREILNKMFDMQFTMIQFRQIKARIDFREKQLKDYDSVNAGIELFNGVVKSKDMLMADLDGDIYAHNRLIGEIKEIKEYLLNEKFTTEEVADMSVGKFDINAWVDKNIKKDEVNPEFSKATNYMG